jgi:hypothetical protein
LLQIELGNITLGDNETITMFLHRTRTLIANIQCISEEVEDKNPKMSFSDAFESSFLTDEKWRQQHPNNTQYVLHLGLLQRMIVGIQESTLKQVSYDFTTQLPQAVKTVERLIEQMIIGEIALPIHQQVVHVSTVSVPNGNTNGGKTNITSSGKSNGNHHCAFHSFGGVKSSHDTKQCNTINKGLTTQDPNNAKWHVLKDSGEHFTPRDRSNALPNASGTKRQSNHDKPPDKLCTKCLQLNREGATIPYNVMKTHTPDKCYRTKEPPFKKSKPKEEEAKLDGTLSKAAVNQIVQAMNASMLKKSDSGRQQQFAIRDID